VSACRVDEKPLKSPPKKKGENLGENRKKSAPPRKPLDLRSAPLQRGGDIETRCEKLKLGRKSEKKLPDIKIWWVYGSCQRKKGPRGILLFSRKEEDIIYLFYFLT